MRPGLIKIRRSSDHFQRSHEGTADAEEGTENVDHIGATSVVNSPEDPQSDPLVDAVANDLKKSDHHHDDRTDLKNKLRIMQELNLSEQNSKCNQHRHASIESGHEMVQIELNLRREGGAPQNS